MDYHASKYLRKAGQIWLLQQQTLRNVEEVVLNSYASLYPPPLRPFLRPPRPGRRAARCRRCAAPPPIESLCKFSVIQKFDLGGQGGVSGLSWGATLSIRHPPAPQILGGQLRMPGGGCGDDFMDFKHVSDMFVAVEIRF